MSQDGGQGGVDHGLLATRSTRTCIWSLVGLHRVKGILKQVTRLHAEGPYMAKISCADSWSPALRSPSQLAAHKASGCRIAQRRQHKGRCEATRSKDEGSQYTTVGGISQEAAQGIDNQREKLQGQEVSLSEPFTMPNRRAWLAIQEDPGARRGELDRQPS